ncbi:MAG: phage tail sheath protein, partial [candidate division NC10 bacterium]|nr:phage tail sheath protein [candidate division NC10 bacterium]
VFVDATKRTTLLNIVYNTGGPPALGGVDINTTTRALTFNAAEVPAAADKVTASYVVGKSDSRKITLRYRGAQEVYTVASGRDLAADIAKTSVLVDGTGLANQDEPPTKFSSDDDFQLFGTGANTRGDDGAVGANYNDGLEKLLNEPAHIIIAAGQDNSFGDELDAHCQQASTDLVKRDRIAVVGTALGATVDSIRGHNLDSDRVIFVAPGIKVTDAAATPPVEVTLPGAYAAAAVAGLLAGLSAHISPTNKTIHVGGLQRRYTAAELTQLVQSRVLALEERQGFRIVKGITTSSNTAWHQITTRRIVDFAKYGVRSAANPYIGRLNNERVRAALKATINSFLQEMVDDEMLVSYDLEVSATRDEEIKGIARVTLVLRPTFSIDFIKVTMFLF